MDIASDTVHLWFANDEEIRDDRLLGLYRDILSDAERAQQQRFVFDRHKHQYLITRALIRVVLSSYVEAVTPREWRFKKNAYDKPYIENDALPIDLHFNISHTENMIVVAVTSGDEVGVDAEHTSRRGNLVDIAETHFSPAEFDEMRVLQEDEQRRRFFELWTLKEAYIKACGMGLSIALNQFSYRFPARGGIEIFFDPARDDHPDHWKFWQIQAGEDHVAALAVRKRRPGTNYSVWMRKIVPLADIRQADYPIVAQSS